MADAPVPTSFSVVLGDVSDQVRDAVAGLIDDHPGMHLAAAASNGDKAAELCAAHRPHLAVVDLMATSLRRQVHEAIRSASPDTVIAVFTARADRRIRDRLLRSGVDAVYDKGLSGDFAESLHALVSAVRSARWDREEELEDGRTRLA